MENREVSSGPQSQARELFVAAFRLLEANNIRSRFFQPADETALALAKGDDIPGRNQHGEGPFTLLYNSISTPGAGTMTSLSGKAALAATRSHSTAGTSPFTSTSFFGATFRM